MRVKVLLAIVLVSCDLFALDMVRVEIRSDQASAKYNVTGKGVIFAMIDRGIDWQNNDFRNADGTTRIAYISDLTDDSGAQAANNAYSKGTIYTQTQINQALQGGAPIPERDYLGHGTANTAIVAGNRRNNPKYHGIAPDTTIIAVKLLNDGTPAFGSTPAVAVFDDPSRVGVAIQFVLDKGRNSACPPLLSWTSAQSAGPPMGRVRSRA